MHEDVTPPEVFDRRRRRSLRERADRRTGGQADRRTGGRRPSRQADGRMGEQEETLNPKTLICSSAGYDFFIDWFGFVDCVSSVLAVCQWLGLAQYISAVALSRP